MENADGIWGSPRVEDIMFADYHYKGGGGPVNLTLRKLNAGAYRLLVYAHGDADEQNSKVSLGTAAGTLGPLSTTAGREWSQTGWRLGIQYVEFGPFLVAEGTEVRVLVEPDASAFGIINGLQLQQLSEGPSSLFYLVPGSYTWEDARSDASLRGGHLATIASAAENLVASQVADAPLWIGGFQPQGSPEPAGGWQWTTGEPFLFTNWRNGAPDNAGTGQEALVINLGGPGLWDDEYATARLGYVLELPAPRRALLQLTVVNGFIVKADVLDPGAGYKDPPAITLSGSGAGAELAVKIEAGQVASVEVVNPGRGYDSSAAAMIAAPPIPPRRATAVAEVVNGFITGVTVVDPGSGYSEPPLVRFVGPEGVGAEAFGTLVDGGVASITVSAPGSGYTTPPRVVIASPPFSPLLAIKVSKVIVEMQVVLGRKYLLESSVDLREWEAVAAPFVAESELLGQEFDVAETGRHFRVTEVP